MDFTFFFAKILLILAVAGGVGFLVQYMVPDLNFRALRVCALIFMILYTVVFSLGDNSGAQGGMLEVIDFLAPYLYVWALLMGLEKRIIELSEFFYLSFYCEIKPKKKPSQKS
jgi:hypothetical protein